MSNLTPSFLFVLFLVFRITSPTHQDSPYGYNSTAFQPVNNSLTPLARPVNFWITVYGFPHTSTSVILSHFAQCGTIIDKKFAPQNGNWIHLRFASTLECEKALNYHERIISNNLMIGVTYCKDPSIIDKENLERNLRYVAHFEGTFVIKILICKYRPLLQH